MSHATSTRPPNAREAITIGVIWIVCGVIAAILFSALDSSNQRIYSELEKHGAIASAIVTATDPGHHNTVYYSFVAGGESYWSADRAWPPNPDATKLRVGERIYVVYDVRNPTVSCACDPRQAAKPNAWWRRIIAGLFLTAIVALVLTVRITRGRAAFPRSKPRLSRLA